jgi:hypothetical protein
MKQNPEICRKDVISKGFYTNDGNGINNTSIQINVEKDIQIPHRVGKLGRDRFEVFI